MQAAFRLTGSAPTPCPLVLAEAGRTCAGGWVASDADVTQVMQRIVWDLAVRNAIPDMFLCPIRKRTYFDQVKFFVPTDDRCRGTIWTLVSANGRRPSVHSAGSSLENRDLAIKAALI